MGRGRALGLWSFSPSVPNADAPELSLGNATVVSLLTLMAQPSEIPELATELYEMSKEYLRQETVEPMKKLGGYAGLGIGGAMLFGFAAILGVMAVYTGLQVLFQEIAGDSPWWNVLARGITTLVAGIVAGIIAWRMSSE